MKLLTDECCVGALVDLLRNEEHSMGEGDPGPIPLGAIPMERGAIMANTEGDDARVTKWMRWIARIWGTLIILVALLFLVGYASNWVTTGVADPYAVEDYPPIEDWPPRLMFLSVLGLALAWRWEGWGGAMAVLPQLVNLPLFLIHWPIARDFPRYLFAPYGVSMLTAIPGVLFMVCWWRSRTR